MIGGKSQSNVRSVALGATVQSAAYGKAIKKVWGRTMVDLSVIWMANMRQENSGKKSKKGNAPNYVANVDFLLAHNPIMGVLQMWVNQNQYLLLDFAKYTTTFALEGPTSITVEDSRFYAVLGVTATIPYDVTFDDYGAQGESDLSGNYEVPFWNMAFNGPDPTFPSSARNLPFCFYWTPAMGNQILLPYAPLGPYGTTATINVYYAQLPTLQEVLNNKIQASGPSGGKSGPLSPLASLNLFFESTLGDGDEYFGVDDVSHVPLSEQQIKYPHIAGMGSIDYPMGASQTFPQTRPELLASSPVYSTGDADFADMVEDIFKGYVQAGIGNDNPRSPIQFGLNCYSLPGCVQFVSSGRYNAPLTPTPNTWTYPLPNVAGDFLIVIASVGNSTGPLTISDTAENEWTPLISGSLAHTFQVWYATARAYNHLDQGSTVTVGIPWSGEPQAQVTLLEVAGVDVLDVTGSPAVVAQSSGNSASVTATGAQGTPELLLALSYCANGESSGAVGTMPPDTLWRTLAGQGNSVMIQSRITYFPQTFTYKAPKAFAGTGGPYDATNVIVFAFRCSQPPSYPQPLGNIFGDVIDQASMQVVRNQCRAAGLYGSLNLDSQSTGKDILTDLYEAMNAWAVWSGFSLKSVARSEVSAVGNGAVYTAPTATGPVIALTETDFASDKEAPVTVSRKGQVNVPDILQVQHPNRASQYNDITISEPESGAIAQYGPRKASPKMMRMFQDPSVSRMYLNIQIRRQNYLRNTYSFPLKANIGKLLEPGDLITFPLSGTMPTLPDQQAIPYIPVPARITSWEEDENFNIKIESEPFIYGCHAPVELPVTDQQGFVPATGGDPGSVDTVIIFEPVPRLSGGQGQLWLVVNGGGPQGSPVVLPDYGGCYVYISTDGVTYNPANGVPDSGSVIGGADGVGDLVANAIFTNGITGTITGFGPSDDWPAADSPDTVNNLLVTLDSPDIQLPAISEADEDNYVYPCYVAGAGNGAPLPVQSAAGAVADSTSCGALFGNPSNVDDVIIVVAGFGGAVFNGDPGTVTCEDTHGNIYTRVAKGALLNNAIAYVFSAPVTAAGSPPSANTVTVRCTTATSITVQAHEFTGIAATPDGGAAVSTNDSGFFDGALYTGPVATTQAGDLLLVFAFDATNSTDTMTVSPPGYDLLLQTSNPGDAGLSTFWQQAGSPAAYQAAVTFTAPGGPGNSWHVGILAFPGVNTTPPIPYELMTYSVAELMSQNGYGQALYQLLAAPSGSPPVDHHLDRGVFGAPAPNVGVDHPLNSRFAFVGPPYPGILKLSLDPSWVGKTLYFKFAAFNSSLGNVQPLSDCTIYQYTPTGGPGGTGASGSTGGNYTQTPEDALSNPSSTSIEMSAVTENFNGNSVQYNARTFTIPNPTSPTTYYVTISDPNYTGDAPGETNLPAICQTSDSLVGQPGNIYIGSIVALPGGGGTIVAPGGASGDTVEILINGG